MILPSLSFSRVVWSSYVQRVAHGGASVTWGLSDFGRKIKDEDSSGGSQIHS